MAQGNKHANAARRMKDARAILQRLKKEALRDPDKPMTGTQQRAAEIFLRKTIPDLKSVEIEGKLEGRQELIIRIPGIEDGDDSA